MVVAIDGHDLEGIAAGAPEPFADDRCGLGHDLNLCEAALVSSGSLHSLVDLRASEFK
jgi:hypothetical protein